MSQQPLYHPTRNPVYQIDVIHAASGKTISATKRRIRWRFGFSNPEAIASGAVGPACRGEEHEVTLIWSLTSGKRLVLADGKEVHFSMGKRTDGKFQTSWTMRGNHVLKLIAHAAPPVKSKGANWKQFDLLLDGMSFSNMTKLYELGTKNGGSSLVPHNQQSSGNYSNYSFAREEEMIYDRAVSEHEHRRAIDRSPSYKTAATAPSYASPPPSVYEERPLQETTTDTTASNDDAFAEAPTHNPDLFYDPTPVSEPQDLLAHSAPALLDYSSPAASTHYVDEFAPRQPEESNQPPSYASIWSSIMGAYGSAPSPGAVQTQVKPLVDAVAHPQAMVEYQTPSQYPDSHYAAPSSEYHPTDVPPTYEEQHYQNEQSQFTLQTNTSNEENIPAVAEKSPTGADSFDFQFQSVLKSLVNLDDIRSKPDTFAGEKKLTLLPDTPKSKSKKGHTKGLPPKASNWQLGPQPSLAELKTLQSPPPKKEVMRPTAFDPAAAGYGMMVVYGQAAPMQPQYQMPPQHYMVPQQPYMVPQQQHMVPLQQHMAPQQGYYGPPPLQNMTGFGAGARMTNGGYGQSQGARQPSYQVRA